MFRKKAIVTSSDTQKSFEHSCAALFHRNYSLVGLTTGADGELIGVFKSNTYESDHLINDRGAEYCEHQLEYSTPEIVDEMAEVDPTPDYVYQDYKTYCEDNYYTPTTPKDLAKTIREKLPGAKCVPRYGEEIWSGLVIREPYN